jgi:hypothetical protein
MRVKKLYCAILFVLAGCAVNLAANLANPSVLLPPARLSVSASYDLGGYSITNDKTPCLMNRFHARFSYAPFSFVNFGVDAGASQVEVASETTSTDTFGVFHGGYGFSGGGHLKLGTPLFFNNTVGVIGIFQGTVFSSKNNAGTVYGGTDAAGGIGLQLHIPNFGFITAGSQVNLIFGKNTDYLGKEGKYSNVNNVRGWLAIDYFPPEILNSKNLYFFSCEIFVSPKAKFNARAPVEEIGFSVSIGAITQRLYGQESDVEWKP